MGSKNARLGKALAMATALVLGLAAPAGAVAEERAIAGPGGFAHGYLTETVTISKGDSIAFANFDIFEHNVVHDVEADGFGGKRNVAWCGSDEGDHHEHAHGCPVFWSGLIAAGETTQVRGLRRVKPGKSYTFFCTLHHNMKGTLEVRPRA